jgi:hypothetical protein
VIELDRADDELWASTSRLYQPGNPDPVPIAINRFGALPQTTAPAITYQPLTPFRNILQKGVFALISHIS